MEENVIFLKSIFGIGDKHLVVTVVYIAQNGPNLRQY